MILLVDADSLVFSSCYAPREKEEIYFENIEEYEKCKELTHYKNILDLDIFLEKLRIKNGQTNYWI